MDNQKLTQPKKTISKSFIVLMTLIPSIAIGVLLGWLIFGNGLDGRDNTMPATPKQETGTSSSDKPKAPTQNYLAFEDWGVKLPVEDDDLYVRKTPSQDDGSEGYEIYSKQVVAACEPYLAGGPEPTLGVLKRYKSGSLINLGDNQAYR